jgi:GMP synthase (glutamine-hydrolysing)
LSHQTILILDFGSQFTQLIARRLRELSVYCEILPFNTPADRLAQRQAAGIILSGGPKSVSEDGAPTCDPALFAIGTASATACSS